MPVFPKVIKRILKNHLVETTRPRALIHVVGMVQYLVVIYQVCSGSIATPITKVYKRKT